MKRLPEKTVWKKDVAQRRILSRPLVILHKAADLATVPENLLRHPDLAVRNRCLFRGFVRRGRENTFHGQKFHSFPVHGKNIRLYVQQRLAIHRTTVKPDLRIPFQRVHENICPAASKIRRQKRPKDRCVDENKVRVGRRGRLPATLVKPFGPAAEIKTYVLAINVEDIVRQIRQLQFRVVANKHKVRIRRLVNAMFHEIVYTLVSLKEGVENKRALHRPLLINSCRNLIQEIRACQQLPSIRRALNKYIIFWHIFGLHTDLFIRNLG